MQIYDKWLLLMYDRNKDFYKLFPDGPCDTIYRRFVYTFIANVLLHPSTCTC